MLALLIPAGAGAGAGAALPATGGTLVAIPGGTFRMGDAQGDANEAPTTVTVRPFRLMQFEVTNRDVARFIRATAHPTDPERSGAGYVWTDRWRLVKGADWRHPHGP